MKSHKRTYKNTTKVNLNILVVCHKSSTGKKRNGAFLSALEQKTDLPHSDYKKNEMQVH